MSRPGGRRPATLRFSLNRDRLTPIAAQAADDAGLGRQCRNPFQFQSILVRGVEIICAIEEALRLIAGYQPPERPHVEVPPRAGTGHGATEAPRGLLYHRYDLDSAGLITAARTHPGPGAASSHALGLGEAVELGLAVERMPADLHIYSIEGKDFGLGPGLTPEVAAATADVAARITAHLDTLRTCPVHGIGFFRVRPGGSRL